MKDILGAFFGKILVSPLSIGYVYLFLKRITYSTYIVVHIIISVTVHLFFSRFKFLIIDDNIELS